MPAAPLALVPLPRQVERTEGESFVLAASTAVVTGGSPAEIALGVLAAEMLTQVVGGPVGLRHEEVPGDLAGDVVLRATGGAAGQVGPDRMPQDEAYTLVADERGVLVEAAGTDGLARGLSTLQQLLVTGPGQVSVPAVRITDRPVHGWRGLSMDVARSFFSPSELRRVIELMADYKLNVLHLHLTDDQGWRIEVPSRPELTERSSQCAGDGGRGGFLTGEEYRALVDFAAARGIRVIPELDMPGHVNAAQHAVPELNVDGRPTEVYTGMEVGFSRLTADLPATEPFVRDVIGDLADLTVGEYLHIGGDEALRMAKDEYVRCVEMAARAAREQGKKVVGWQEIVAAPLEPGTVVQYWDTRQDPAPLVSAARQGVRLLMSPADRTYLDMHYYQGFPLGQDWAGLVTLRDSYDWEPTTLMAGLPPEAVIGVEAAVFTEKIHTLDQLTRMLLPRLAAVAEVAWTPVEQRDLVDFTTRLAAHGPAWTAAGHTWEPVPGVAWPAS